MPDLLGYDGQVFGYGFAPTDPGEYDLLGVWNPGATMAAKKQVLRVLRGQPARIVFTPDGTYPLPENVALYLEDDPDEPAERECEVQGDGTVVVTLPAHVMDVMAVKTHKWEVWMADGPTPMASGILIVSESVRQDVVAETVPET